MSEKYKSRKPQPQHPNPAVPKNDELNVNFFLKTKIL